MLTLPRPVKTFLSSACTYYNFSIYHIIILCWAVDCRHTRKNRRATTCLKGRHNRLSLEGPRLGLRLRKIKKCIQLTKLLEPRNYITIGCCSSFNSFLSCQFIKYLSRIVINRYKKRNCFISKTEEDINVL